jgi:hypothetical protein
MSDDLLAWVAIAVLLVVVVGVPPLFERSERRKWDQKNEERSR